MQNYSEIEARCKNIEYAIFDIDNTISKTNILDLYFYIKKKKINNNLLYKLWFASFISTHIPIYIILDFISREWFQKAFMNRISEFTLDELSLYSKQFFKEKITKRFIPETLELIEYFKQKKVKVVLLSVSLEPLVKQYANYFNVSYYECLKVVEKDGKAVVDFSNHKDFKLNFIKNFDPSKVVSIADSKHDLPVLNYSVCSIVIVLKKVEKWINNLTNPIIISSKGMK